MKTAINRVNDMTIAIKNDSVSDAIHDMAHAMGWLQAHYPTEEVAIWAVRNCRSRWYDRNYYLAYVGGPEPEDNREYSTQCATPLEAVNQLIERSGIRNPVQNRQAKIFKLKEQIAKLEAEISVAARDQYARTQMEETSHGSAETVEVTEGRDQL